MDAAANPTNGDESTERRWQRLAEDFIAMHLVETIRQSFAHIQNLMTFSVASGLLLLWCFNSYPFEPHRVLNASCFGLLLWTVGSLVLALIRFNRNEALSRLGKTHQTASPLTARWCSPCSFTASRRCSASSAWAFQRWNARCSAGCSCCNSCCGRRGPPGTGSESPECRIEFHGRTGGPS